MPKSIKISPRHGLNPSISVCFFCGEDKSEIVLAGKVDRADTAMPMRMIFDYEPCDKCKEKMANGITLIGVSTKPLTDNRPEIQNGLYPTGNWCVVSEDFSRRFFQEDVLISVLEKRKCFVDDELLTQLVNRAE